MLLREIARIFGGILLVLAISTFGGGVRAGEPASNEHNRHEEYYDWQQAATYLFDDGELSVWTRNKVDDDGGLLHMTQIRRGDGSLLKSNDTYGGEGLRGAEYHSPYLFLRWGLGAHGETVEVFDYHSGEQLFLQNSSWSVDILPRERGVELSWTGDYYSDPSYPETFTKMFMFKSSQKK